MLNEPHHHAGYATELRLCLQALECTNRPPGKPHVELLMLDTTLPDLKPLHRRSAVCAIVLQYAREGVSSQRVGQWVVEIKPVHIDGTTVLRIEIAGPGTASGSGAATCYTCAAGTAGTGSCNACSELIQIKGFC